MSKVYYDDDKTDWVVGITVVVILIIAFIGVQLSPASIDKNPRVGDVWEFYGTGDPFKKEQTYRRRVLDIKMGYIQFIENDRDTLSRTIDVFMYNSKMVSRVYERDKVEPIKTKIAPITPLK